MKEVEAMPVTENRAEVGSRLLVSGQICLANQETIALQRGMAVVTAHGDAVGRVAAVMRTCDQRRLTHFLLGQAPAGSVYFLIPLTQIEQIEGQLVRLRLAAADIDLLPQHEPD